MLTYVKVVAYLTASRRRPQTLFSLLRLAMLAVTLHLGALGAHAAGYPKDCERPTGKSKLNVYSKGLRESRLSRWPTKRSAYRYTSAEADCPDCPTKLPFVDGSNVAFRSTPRLLAKSRASENGHKLAFPPASTNVRFRESEPSVGRSAIER